MGQWKEDRYRETGKGVVWEEREDIRNGTNANAVMGQWMEACKWGCQGTPMMLIKCIVH